MHSAMNLAFGGLVAVAGLMGAGRCEAQAVKSKLLPSSTFTILSGGLGGGEVVSKCVDSDACRVKVTVKIDNSVDPANCTVTAPPLVLAPKAANTVSWMLFAASGNPTATIQFIQPDPMYPAKKYGVMIADNIDPSNPAALVWKDTLTSATRVDKAIVAPGASRRFKASAYSAFVEYKLAGDVSFTACAELDPVIMNDGQ